MRALPQTLIDAFASRSTTLCRCWRVTRADGLTLGFTDHDRDLTVDGVIHAASSALGAGAIELSTGLGVDTQAVSGALSSDAITPRDLELGLWDGAEVRTLLVDWQDPATRLVLAVGTIGEVERAGRAFECEVAGRAEALNRPVGRAYVPRCHRRLGDPKCGVDLGAPGNVGAGTVTEPRGGSAFAAAGLEGFAADAFSGGLLTWTSGANAGGRLHLRRHAVFADGVELEGWQAPVFAVEPGDAFRVTAGCDKTLGCCRDRFANQLNFRGFPHLPGDDWATGYPEDGGGHDGGSLFR